MLKIQKSNWSACEIKWDFSIARTFIGYSSSQLHLEVLKKKLILGSTMKANSNVYIE